ncbi:uncharacterized protein ACLA_077850 [Aspergillus clavatus NRRL 1]|uniref:Uncharacterized protein n=1 Tax=Aspergillus clavatus (strain ATCC 1007 / CBS 513.65 / DSM 816 / NCTC 3887 / NRRL 1 / QM 1276 / 107) TaxID=344612 RepID=A1CLQ9_ASPCL|nr:uncharacterized protein ACLA_077850 [Aspergillus clavatus NRRL 1]EAW09038.1 conserved hypothetical protein [Aspergillus clavatus NRRL 1]
MRFLDTLLLGLAVAGNTVLATIDLGQIENGAGQALLNVAWIGGDNPCKTKEYVSITASAESPCGVRFTLSNGYTYYEGNCGTSAIDIWNNNGTFNSHCQNKSWKYQLNHNTWIRQTWTCY